MGQQEARRRKDRDGHPRRSWQAVLAGSGCRVLAMTWGVSILCSKVLCEWSCREPDPMCSASPLQPGCLVLCCPQSLGAHVLGASGMCAVLFCVG